MSLIDRAIRKVMDRQESRSVDMSDLGSEAFGYALSGQASTPDAGENVTVESAMRAAMGAAIRLIADDVASLPLKAYRKDGDGREPLDNPPQWLSTPGVGRFDTTEEFVSDLVVSLLSDGNIFLDCQPNTIVPSKVAVLPPERVDILNDADPAEPPTYNIEGVGEYQQDRIAHTSWVRMPGTRRGLNMVEQAREFTGLELAARRWAGNFFQNGATLGGVVVLPREAKKPTKDEVAALRSQFEYRHKGNRKSWLLGILTGGASIVDGSIKPQEAELRPLWDHVLEEACRLYHVPPHMLASQAGASAFASVEHRSIEYVQHAIVPVVTRLEGLLSLLIPGEDTFVRFNVDALLRGDMKTRAETRAIESNHRIITRDEWRASEDYPPAPEGEGGYLLTPNSAVPDPVYEELSKLIRAGFDPEQSLTYLGLKPLKHLGFQPTTQYIVADPAETGDSAPATDGPAQDTVSARTADPVVVNIENRPPDVHVNAPVKVDVDSNAMADAVEELAETHARSTAEAQEALSSQVDELGQQLLADEVTHIERDESGNAVTMVKTKGNRVDRRDIKRDADNRIVGAG